MAKEASILYRGAEAEICLASYMGMTVVQKRRMPKKYRITEIDRSLITIRTREESKLMVEARTHGISVPIIYDVDLIHGIITMEYLRGQRIKDIFNTLHDKEQMRLCKKIGESIAQLHNYDIIHGDITTSNMILLHDRIHLIDFGLGCQDTEIEAKGVDLHVLMEAFESTHARYSRCFDYVLEGYKNTYTGNAYQVINKIEEIVRRGRYRQ